MTSFTPTDEQLSIMDAMRLGGSQMVTAYAGCAKTTSMTLAAKAIPPTPGLCLAFNVKNKKDLEVKFPDTFQVKTLNGLGHMAWGRALGKRLAVDDQKLGKIVSDILREAGDRREDAWATVRQLVTLGMQAGIVPHGLPYSGLMLDVDESWKELSDNHFLDATPQDILYARKALAESVQIARGVRGVPTISFDEQIYCSALLGGVFPRFPLVMVDEAQDMSVLNIIQIRRVAADRIFVVGDQKQCHPAGTKIRMGGEKLKNIENVVAGDKVMSLEMGHAYFRGAVRAKKGLSVLKTVKIPYSDDLIKITAGEYEHLCTLNHRCLIKIDCREEYGIYLMQKGHHFRIGICKLLYANGCGPFQRAASEGADALWILTSTATRDQALIEEKLICATFGLMDITFASNSEAHLPQHVLDNIWTRVGDNSDKAFKCLKYFGRDFRYPIWTKEDSYVQKGRKAFITQACNLLPTVMSCRVFDGNLRGVVWYSIDIERIPFEGFVYGIEIEPNKEGKHLYLANDIVTHNSIYGFRGADHESMSKMLTLRSEWKHLPLATTFRCPKLIVERQQAHAPGFRAWHTNPNGSILNLRPTTPDEYKGWTWANIASEAQAFQSNSIAILCRNNAPLLAAAFKLIRQGIGCVMLGRDIGKGLVALSKKICPEDVTPIDVFIGLVRDWKDRESALAMANKNESKLAGIMDRAECLLAVAEAEGVASAGGARVALQSLFARDRGLVTLATGHRAKGLEWDVVLHLDPWRIPSKFAREAVANGDGRQMEQERNLLYVIETRAKHTLINASLEDFH